MSEQRTRAGRRRFTVDALFVDTSARGVGVADLPDARLVQLDRIQPDPRQPRRTFDEERLDELAASIRAAGVLQPIALRYDEAADVYIIVHGERRWRAAGMAGLRSIPAIVRDVPEDHRLVQQLMENVVREDLNALDRAAALRTLKEQMGNPSWERVAESVGIRRSRLFQLLDTERLDDSIQEAIRRGVVSEKQTRPLHRLDPELQAEIGERVLSGALQPRDLPEATRIARACEDVDAARTALDTLSRDSRPPADNTSRVATATARQLTRQATTMAKSLAAVTPELFDAVAAAERAKLAAALRDIRRRADELLSDIEPS